MMIPLFPLTVPCPLFPSLTRSKGTSLRPKHQPQGLRRHPRGCSPWGTRLTQTKYIAVSSHVLPHVPGTVLVISTLHLQTSSSQQPHGVGTISAAFDEDTVQTLKPTAKVTAG